MIHEDPFTGRAFRKPRGYAGDAELIDLIYGPEELWAKPQASPLGLNIYQYTSAAPAAEGFGRGEVYRRPDRRPGRFEAGSRHPGRGGRALAGGAMTCCRAAPAARPLRRPGCRCRQP